MKRPLFYIALYFLFCSGILYAQNVQDTQKSKNLEEGIWQYQHENYEEALEILKKARKETPQSSLAAYYLGLTYKQLQDYKKAWPELEDAIKLRPPIKGALIELIDLLYKLNRLQEAKRWISVAEREYIRPSQTAFMKGLILLKEGKDLEGAIASFEDAKKLDSSLTQVADYQIAMAHVKAKRLEEAKTIFSGVVTQDPTTNLAVFADQYADAIKDKQYLVRPLKLMVRGYWQYDSNVILRPMNESYVGGIAGKGDSSQVYNWRGDYTLKPSDYYGVRFGYSGAYGKQKDLGFYDNAVNNFEIQPSLYFGDVMVSFPATYNHFVVNDKNYLSMANVGNFTNILLTKDQMLQGAFTYRNKYYLWPVTQPAEQRSGNEYVWHAGYYCFFAKNKGFINFKHAMNYDYAKGSNWRCFGNRTAATLLVPVSDRIKYTAVGEFFLQNFVKMNSVYDGRRLDTMYILSNLLAIQIFKGAEVQLQYTYINNGSNLGVYAYRRHICSVGLQYTF